MSLHEKRWAPLLQGPGGSVLYSQESPILPDVWSHFLDTPEEPADLLLTPFRPMAPGDLSRELSSRLPKPRAIGSTQAPLGVPVANETGVAIRLEFEELITHLVPLSKFWKEKVLPQTEQIQELAAAGTRVRGLIYADLDHPGVRPTGPLGPAQLWWIRLVGTVAWVVQTRRRKRPPEKKIPPGKEQFEQAAELLARAVKADRDHAERRKKQKRPVSPGPFLYSVAVDRPAQMSVAQSVRTVKADAVRRVFDLTCRQLTWAVVDSGVDPRHQAFRDKNGETRVRRIFDFTRLRRMLELMSSPHDGDRKRLSQEFGMTVTEARRIARAIKDSRDLDWGLLVDSLEVGDSDADVDKYAEGLNPHGTHVAGIIGADPPKKDLASGAVSSGGEEVDVGPGMCPDIKLYDLRVLDGAGTGKEFEIIASLQFLRYLNANSKLPVVHGANLSFSIPHKVENYAAGRTPVCDECDRLAASGVVAVAAAGNLGLDPNLAPGQASGGGYRDISITDPGNAESVFTVGATHRKLPHEYGVSYFSSRGPTGDGRVKPDLVAPGEKVTSCVPDGRYDVMNGTSQAAPHVSGAAALLMARHEEFIGDPRRIKEILCETATDLGRERYFQGAGLVDVLRAIQSV